MASKQNASPQRTPTRTSRPGAPGSATTEELVIRFAHELRTPLSATLLWTRLLNSPEATDPAQLREGLEAIETSAKEQQALIDQLVDVAHLLADRVELHPTTIALPTFALRVINPLQPLARSRKIALNLSADPAAATIQADAPRLQQILRILLVNALQFTPAGGRVSLELNCGRNFIMWRVIDTGAGIAARFLPHLFELYPQEKPSGSRASAGLGVSLFLAHRLVTLHHGTLTAQSDGPGQGTTFSLRLPCPAPKSDRPRAKVVA